MKKHVEGDHNALMKRLAEDANCIVITKVPTN
jgi:hypothetical protein